MKYFYYILVLTLTIMSYASKNIVEIKAINPVVKSSLLKVSIFGVNAKEVDFQDINSRKIYKSTLKSDGKYRLLAFVELKNLPKGSYTFKLLFKPTPENNQPEFIFFKVE